MLGEGAQRAAFTGSTPPPHFLRGSWKPRCWTERPADGMLTPRPLARAIARRAFESPFTRPRASDQLVTEGEHAAGVHAAIAYRVGPARRTGAFERRPLGRGPHLRIVRATLMQTLDLLEAKAHARHGEARATRPPTRSRLTARVRPRPPAFLTRTHRQQLLVGVDARVVPIAPVDADPVLPHEAHPQVVDVFRNRGGVEPRPSRHLLPALRAPAGEPEHPARVNPLMAGVIPFDQEIPLVGAANQKGDGVPDHTLGSYSEAHRVHHERLARDVVGISHGRSRRLHHHPVEENITALERYRVAARRRSDPITRLRCVEVAGGLMVVQREGRRRPQARGFGPSGAARYLAPDPMRVAAEVVTAPADAVR